MTSSDQLVPDRWMRVRRGTPFTDAHWRTFQASTRVFAAFADAYLADASALIGEDHPALKYDFFPAEISDDRTVMSLPIGGERTLGSRYKIENSFSYLLWLQLPPAIYGELEEGITEDTGNGPQTNWRRLESFIILRPEAMEVLRRVDGGGG